MLRPDSLFAVHRAPVKAAMSLLPTPLPLQPRQLAAALLLFVAGPLAAQAPATHEHGFRDAEKWARVFDDPARDAWQKPRSEEHTSELQSQSNLVCRLLLEKKKTHTTYVRRVM